MLFGGIAILLFPANKDKLDFSEFYAAAQMVREGHGQDLYDLPLQVAFQSKVALAHAVYLRPPFETLLFIPFTYVSYRTAYTFWVCLNLVLIGVAAFFIDSVSQVGAAFWRYIRIRGDLGLILAIFLTFAPTTTCLLLGQDSIFMTFLYATALFLWKQKFKFAAGCVLACGLFKFHLMLPFLFILLIRKKWKLLTGFTCTGGALVLISLAISGTRVLFAYPRLLLSEKSNREIMGFHPDFTPNMHGLLYLLGEGWVGPSAVTFISVVCSIAILWWAIRSWRDERFELSISAAMLATLLVSYHAYNYDLVLLLLPVALLCGSLGEVEGSRDSKLLLAALVLIFLPPVHFVLVTRGMYALMCVPILVLFGVVVRLLRREPREALPA